MGCHSQVAVNRPDIRQLALIAATGSYTDTAGVVHHGGAVHWNRVHKLPDHVYFSHQWHVKAQVACQTCHGPVEKMTVLRQHAPLTMGWCLECHRRSHYVGGPSYKPGDAASFSVGTANYDVLRRRQRTDPEVAFAERAVKGDSAAPVATGQQAKPDPAPTTDTTATTLKRLLASHPDLPRWRVVDLPESHQAFYQDLIDAKGGLLSASFMNATTQCSTCHQ
jgi:hypothetical protein